MDYYTSQAQNGSRRWIWIIILLVAGIGILIALTLNSSERGVRQTPNYRAAGDKFMQAAAVRGDSKASYVLLSGRLRSELSTEAGWKREMLDLFPRGEPITYEINQIESVEDRDATRIIYSFKLGPNIRKYVVITIIEEGGELRVDDYARPQL